MPDLLNQNASLRSKIYEFILRSGSAGLTDDEITNYFRVSGDSIRPRRAELVKARLVVATHCRRRTRSGRTAIVWLTSRVAKKVRRILRA